MSEETAKPFDGKRLYTVEIKQEIVVLAADEDEAEEVAREAAQGGDVDWSDAAYAPEEVYARLPPGWSKAIPFGIPSDMKQQTCEQILDAWQAYREAPTQAELEAAGQQRLI